MKVVNAFLAIIFVLFAYFQWNDPDPLLWILLYLYIALISGLAIVEKISKWIVFPGMFVCTLGLAFLLPEFINWLKGGAPTIVDGMKAEEPHIELTREFLGIGISLLVLFYHYFRSVKR